MKPITRHIIYWLGGAAFAFAVIFISVNITDTASLDGTRLQRNAAGLNLFMAWPGYLLYQVLPNADGPVYLSVEVAAWGIILGEVALLIKRMATK